VVKGQHKSGHSIDVQISLSVHDCQGQRHTFAVITDPTAFKEQGRKFDEMAGRLKRAVKASNDGIWEWNLKDNTVWYSDRFVAMTGVEDAVDTPDLGLWRRHVDPLDWARVTNAIEQHLSRREKFDVTYRGRGEQGDYEWFHTRGDTLFDEQGEPVLLSGTLTNIHRMHVLEEALEQQTRFLNQVLQRSLSGLYLFDLRHRSFTYINEEFTRLTGYQLPQLQEMSPDFANLYHPDDVERIQLHRQAVEQMSGSGAAEPDSGSGLEYRLRHRNGEWRWLYSQDSVYTRDQQGQPLEMLGTCFDITELKQAEQRLFESNASLERFAYAASHDLQEPLRKIGAFSRALEQRLSGQIDDPEALFQLGRIIDAAGRMREMIDKLLQLSRLTRARLDRAEVHMSVLLAGVIDDLSIRLQDQEVRMVLAHDFPLSVDRSTFSLVLRNLVSNSLNYRQATRALLMRIEARHDAQSVEIRFSDNGQGFRTDQSELIFEPFQRLVGRDIPGTGMGLAICRQIIQAHGGTIEAESEPGAGATFIIRLPILVEAN
jgi:PAS domain S-box-containing protein